MKEILLTKNKFALVDDEDYHRINQFKWHVNESRNKIYAVRHENNKLIRMHRDVLYAPDNLFVDHVDGNGLNNQKFNLRLCTSKQNQFNSSLRSDNVTGYKGVSFVQEKQKYSANIKIDGKTKFLGYFTDSIDAAKMYDRWAVKMFGEFAKTNF